ncbi:MAG: cation-translocating P-type ATPase [Clostridia bacterium]|nr:cation-translocating P-type ATPase [Clostridia bacterium]
MKQRKDTGSTPLPTVPVKETLPDFGLTAEEVSERQNAALDNAPVESPTKTVGQIILSHSLTFFNLVFLILAVCLFIVGTFKNTLFLLIAIANTLIGIFQEIRAKHTIDKMTLTTAQRITAIRDGQKMTVRSDTLVRDDIVEFAPGDQICADAIVVTGQLQVNEALVTGEADQITKSPGETLLSGSFVVAGHARARLTKVGAQSYASRLTLEAKRNLRIPKSEMMLSLSRLIRVIGILLIPMGVLLFMKQYSVLGMPLKDAMESTVAALIGMIPEGLYLLTSVALAVSVIKLSRKKVLTQNMNCIETLARVDVLCVDKTGTITEEKMVAGDPVLLNEADFPAARVNEVLGAYYAIADGDNDTENAMIRKFRAAEWDCRSRIPFTSATKWSSAVFAGEGAFLVGAPEFILGRRFDLIREAVDMLSSTGYRVLLLAQYDGIPDPKGLQIERVYPMALIPLTNRIRPDAPETFRYFAEQGVSIRVISGDNPRTVAEVARQAGIPGASKFIDAAKLKEDADYDEAVEKYTVFGRVTPEQKRKLIRALQKAGHTVAMTGDGVNDVLALKDADCGIAMASGSDAARRVAQLVLLDSNFKSMPSVVGEGRRVINNIQRSASLFLVKNIFSFLLALLTLIFEMPYPLVPIQLSMVSALLIGAPSFFLALEPNRERVRGRFMLNVLRQAFPGGLTNVLIVLLLQAFAAVFAIPNDQLCTMATAILSVVGLVVLLQISHPLSGKRTVMIAVMAIGVIICFAALGPVFDFVALDTGAALILTTLLILSVFVMQTLLKLFNFGDSLLEKLRKKLNGRPLWTLFDGEDE